MTTRRSAAALLALAVALFGLAGCNSRVDDSEGGVILSVTDFDGLPLIVSVNEAALTGAVQVGEIRIENLPKDPNGATSDLMNVEMQSYEIVYTRVDSGTRVPTPLVSSIFGVVPVNGEIVYENFPILLGEQLDNPPLSDLLVLNGGIDSETGGRRIALELRIRFFGRTLTGDNVATAPIRFDVEFVP